MPHLTIEYTDNLIQFDAKRVLPALNRTLAATGQFAEADIKSRAVALQQFAVGTEMDGRGFVHVRLAILSGRTVEVKRDLANRLLQALHACGISMQSGEVQLCVEILEIERETYAKMSFTV
jgi:5-carboxymethyl-2-hydroxymuconate isomerase